MDYKTIEHLVWLMNLEKEILNDICNDISDGEVRLKLESIEAKVSKIYKETRELHEKLSGIDKVH